MRKIAFFCTGGMGVAASKYIAKTTYLPRRAADWDLAMDEGVDLEARFFVSLPGTHLVDALADKLTDLPEKMSYEVLPATDGIDDILQKIASYGPDVAIPLSIPDIPYDWNAIRDAVIAEKLSDMGIRTIATSSDRMLDAFDKGRMNNILESNGFNVARHLLVSGNLFHAERDPDITKNFYTEYVYHKLEAFRYPVVIKPSYGAGSVGLTVAKDFAACKEALLAADGDLDLMVEEWISGDNFGVEIYGQPGDYTVTSPVLFSVTDDGMTDPFASIKFGSVDQEKYHVAELSEVMLRLADLMGLSGTAEVDLIFSDGKWFIIEVNPRYSLLALVPATMEGRSVFLPYMELAGFKREKKPARKRPVIDFKAPVLDDERMAAIKDKYGFISYIMRFSLGENVGFCEFVVYGDDRETLLSNVRQLYENEPDILAKKTYDNIVQIVTGQR